MNLPSHKTPRQDSVYLSQWFPAKFALLSSINVTNNVFFLPCIKQHWVCVCFCYLSYFKVPCPALHFLFLLSKAHLLLIPTPQMLWVELTLMSKENKNIYSHSILSEAILMLNLRCKSSPGEHHFRTIGGHNPPALNYPLGWQMLLVNNENDNDNNKDALEDALC